MVSQEGVEYPTANDNKTAYFAVSNMGPDNFFSTHEDFCQFVVDALSRFLVIIRFGSY